MSARIVCGPATRAGLRPCGSWKVSWATAASSTRSSTYYQAAHVVVEFERNADLEEHVDAARALDFLRRDGQDDTSALQLCAEDGSGPVRLSESKIAGGGRPTLDFLLDTLQRSATSTHAQRITLIGPRGNGNIIRSDIIPKRMHDAEHVHVETAVPLAKPCQLFIDEAWTESTDFLTLFDTSAGALRLSLPAGFSPEFWSLLEEELEKRLSLPLVIRGLQRRTIFLVEGGLGLPFGGACSWQLYETAKALAIDIVVLAGEGHVLQTRAEFLDWYHHFIPVVCGFDADFPARIVAAVKGYEMQSGKRADAIVTFYESYHVAVSAAAKQLGLSCEPVSAYDIATDKFKTSVFEGRKSFTASSVDEALHIAKTEHVPWPIILKPCRGWASELVFKVDDIDQLQQAAPHMKSDSHGADFVMEHYCSGPEVDINFIMYEGEVLFWEIGDETPKNADSGSTSFGELDYLFPSELPQSEQEAVYNSVLQSITRLGFRNGIYHCEARIENSSVEWRFKPSGLPVLEPRQAHNGKPAESWLIEINTRPPGGDTCDFIEATWGVDYWALLLATKLRDASAWVKALSQPYRGGAQYHADKIWILADFDESKKGVWESGNITEELMQRRPDLAKQVSQHRTFAKKGDQMRDTSTGVNNFVAYLHIFSRQSRSHLLELAGEIRKELVIEYS